MRRPIDLGNGVYIGQMFASTEVDYTPFGMRGHNGADYPAPIGRPVYAPENGVVIMSSNGVTDQYARRGIAGQTVVIKGNSYEHWLLHLSSRNVTVGQSVSEGELVGYSGNTGYTTGPHLHWGVRPHNPDMNNGYRGFIDPTIALNTIPPAPPAPVRPTISVTPFAQPYKMYSLNAPAKWNLDQPSFGDIVNNPLPVDQRPITARAYLTRSDLPNYVYYLEDPNSKLGYNSRDCIEYTPPPPPPPPAAPVTAKPAEKYTVITTLMAFSSADDAKYHKGVANPLMPGEYFVYDKLDKCYNLTTNNVKNQNTWIHIDDNKEYVEPPKPVEPVVIPAVPTLPVDAPPLQTETVDVVVRDESKDWMDDRPVRADEQPVKMIAIKSMQLHDLTGKFAKYPIELKAGNKLDIVSFFYKTNANGELIKYYRDKIFVAKGYYYSLSEDLLVPFKEPVVQQRPVIDRDRYDYNNDGDVNISDFIDYASRKFGSSIKQTVAVLQPKLEETNKRMKRSIDGFTRRQK